MMRIIRSIWRRLTSKNYSNEQPLVRLGQGDYEREIWYSAHSQDVPSWDKETNNVI